MTWTDERIDLLKALWLEGLSATQVAAKLGGVTRGAVIGKVHRLGIATRGAPTRPAPRPKPRPMAEVMTRAPRTVLVKQGPSPVSRIGPYEQRVVAAGVNAALKAEPEPVERVELLATAGILDLGAHACRWPIGNPAADDFGFCGRPRERGSYCATHGKRAHGSTPSGLQDRNLTRGVL